MRHECGILTPGRRPAPQAAPAAAAAETPLRVPAALTADGQRREQERRRSAALIAQLGGPVSTALRQAVNDQTLT